MIPHLKVAVDFAQALVEGNFDRAHAFLAPSVQEHTSVERLRDDFYGMFRGYADGDARRLHYDEDFCYRESSPLGPISSEIGWASSTGGEVGNDAFWAYIGIEGDDFLEAVSVRVTEFGGTLLINEIQWGRP